MKKIILQALAGLMLILLSSCLHDQPDNIPTGTDLGLIPIGGVPIDMSIFTSTDCNKYEPKFYDCSADDAQGRKYAFFHGGVARVSVNKNSASDGLRLPAGIQFGENIKSAATKVGATLGVKLSFGKSQDGMIVYASDFIVRSITGSTYSFELIADEEGRLVEVIERVNLP